MPYVGLVQHTTPQMNATAEFPTLTASEESNLILQDVFECDQDGMNAVLEAFFADQGIAMDWDLNGDEMDDLIIEHEDELHTMYQMFRDSF